MESLTCYNFVVADLSLEQTTYQFREQPEASEVCINIANNVTIEAIISITLLPNFQDGTADMRDVQLLQANVVATIRTCFDIIISPDEILEETEILALSVLSNDSRLRLSVSEGEITIFDGSSKSLNVTLTISVRIHQV